MSALTLFSVTDPQTPVWHSTDAKAIQDQLNAKGVRFERWQADRDLGANPSPETVIAAYQHAIDKLVAEKGYQSWDVISLRADNPQKEALREKFLNEHTHGEDEVRFFVEGAGLFCLHIGDEVFQVLRAWSLEMTLGELFDNNREQVKESLARNIEHGRKLSGPDVGRAAVLHTQLFRSVQAFFETYDVLALPVSPVAPFDLAEEFPQQVAGRGGRQAQLVQVDPPVQAGQAELGGLPLVQRRAQRG